MGTGMKGAERGRVQSVGRVHSFGVQYSLLEIKLAHPFVYTCKIFKTYVFF